MGREALFTYQVRYQRASAVSRPCVISYSVRGSAWAELLRQGGTGGGGGGRYMSGGWFIIT